MEGKSAGYWRKKKKNGEEGEEYASEEVERLRAKGR
jgi:hypothetical protein